MKHTKGKFTIIVHQFNWEGSGSVPTVEMTWEGQRMIFDVPVAMMEAYKELEEQKAELLEALTEIKEQADGYGVINHTWLNSLCSEAIKKAS